MAKYAEKTTVSSSKSRDEIEKILVRYGANGFMYGFTDVTAVIAFKTSDRHVKFSIPLPDKSSDEFCKTPGRGRSRSKQQIDQAYEQAVRQKWRALALVVKAKLEAVEAGITTFDNEFMSNIVMPDGGTVGDFVQPKIEQAYGTGKMPVFLLGN